MLTLVFWLGFLIWDFGPSIFVTSKFLPAIFSQKYMYNFNILESDYGPLVLE